MARKLEIDETRPMTEVKFRKTGGSLSVIWPSANAAALHVKDGSTAKIAYTKTGEQVIIPVVKPARKYALAELLDEMPEQADLSQDHAAWEAMRPAGDEI